MLETLENLFIYYMVKVNLRVHTLSNDCSNRKCALTCTRWEYKLLLSICISRASFCIHRSSFFFFCYLEVIACFLCKNKSLFLAFKMIENIKKDVFNFLSYAEIENRFHISKIKHTHNNKITLIRQSTPTSNQKDAWSAA